MERVISLDEIRAFFIEDKIPMCYAIKSKEKDKNKHKQILGEYSINKLGWKLCLFEAIGLRTKTPINKIDIKKLETHFLN